MVAALLATPGARRAATRRAASRIGPLAGVSFALALSCKPNIEGRPSLVDSSRVVAVKSMPAEEAPGDPAGVTYTALYVSPDEHASATELDWAFCNARKPIAVIGPSAIECLVPASKVLTPLGKGETVMATLAKDDCSVFGPSPPTPKQGEPASRPADPDTTGGYYQPVRLLVPTDTDPDYVVGVTRLACGVSGATQDQALDFADRYRPNENPALLTIDVRHPGGQKDSLKPTGDTVLEAKVVRNEHVTFQVSWFACPTTSTCGDGICGASEYAMDRPLNGMTVKGCPDDCMMPKGCTGSEPYVELDPESRTIVSHREAMRVAWFATDGSFDHDGTGRTEGEADNASSENDWVAPSAKGTVRMWVVLRDDRGGVGWSELSIDVGP